jgi:hypothetical protein
VETLFFGKSIEIDTELKSRTFQDVTMTYKEVVNVVLKDVEGAGVDCQQ